LELILPEIEKVERLANRRQLESPTLQMILTFAPVALFLLVLESAAVPKADKGVQGAETRGNGRNRASSSSSSSSSQDHRRGRHSSSSRNSSSLSSSSSSTNQNVSRDKTSSSSRDSRWETRSVNLINDVGFFSFNYGLGNAGTAAFESFYFNYPYGTRIQFVDCFCAGDKYIIQSQVDATTISADACPVFDLSCPPSLYRKQPLDCLLNANWCKSSSVLVDPGFRNYTIEIKVSPFLAGTGFVILQQDCDGVACCTLTPQGCEYSIYK
jgi:hypothetical protein